MEANNPQKILPLAAILEAALFLSHEPLSLRKLSKLFKTTEQKIKDSLESYKEELKKEERGLVLLETEQGYQLGTKPEVAPFLEQLFIDEEYLSASLSQAALETLAIVALKQPVTKLEIENIRGVKTDGVIDNLVKRGLIKVLGRKETLGRPMIYGITENFLQYFGFKDRNELEKLKKLWLNDTFFPEAGETK
ncbi:MAG: SMC-Scp complex subunit ScpB [Firmicutes bacterium]|nr:SMC-Scp complex subunit ScpB [Bacillota bacterium]